MHDKRDRPRIVPDSGAGDETPASKPASLARLEVRAPRDRMLGEPTRPQAPIADGTGPSALLAYWTECRYGQRPPALASLDLRKIAFFWPGSVLFRIGIDGQSPQVERVFHGAASFSGKAGADDSISALPGTLAVTEWLLSVVRGVARNGKWIEQEESFVGPEGAGTVRCLALPVGSDVARVEFVLCNVWSMPRPVH